MEIDGRKQIIPQRARRCARPVNEEPGAGTGLLEHRLRNHLGFREFVDEALSVRVDENRAFAPQSHRNNFTRKRQRRRLHHHGIQVQKLCAEIVGKPQTVARR